MARFNQSGMAVSIAVFSTTCPGGQQMAINPRCVEQLQAQRTDASVETHVLFENH